MLPTNYRGGMTVWIHLYKFLGGAVKMGWMMGSYLLLCAHFGSQRVWRLLRFWWDGRVGSGLSGGCISLQMISIKRGALLRKPSRVFQAVLKSVNSWWIEAVITGDSRADQEYTQQQLSCVSVLTSFSMLSYSVKIEERAALHSVILEYIGSVSIVKRQSHKLCLAWQCEPSCSHMHWQCFVCSGVMASVQWDARGYGSAPGMPGGALASALICHAAKNICKLSLVLSVMLSQSVFSVA